MLIVSCHCLDKPTTSNLPMGERKLREQKIWESNLKGKERMESVRREGRGTGIRDGIGEGQGVEMGNEWQGDEKRARL